MDWAGPARKADRKVRRIPWEKEVAAGAASWVELSPDRRPQGGGAAGIGRGERTC
jgi:hypothetical protein